MNYLLVVFASYLLGILSGRYLPKEFVTFLWPIPLLFMLWVVIGLWSKASQIRSRIFPALLSLLFIWLGFSFLHADVDQIDDLPPHHLTHYLTAEQNPSGFPITFTGLIIEPPEHFVGKTRLRLEVQKIILPKQNIMTSGIVQLNWYAPTTTYRFYDTVQVTARLKIPLDYQNPGVFSYTDYLHQKGIYATGKILSICKVARTIPCSRLILRGIYGFRLRISKYIKKTTSESVSPLLQAIILGERYKVSTRLKELFSEAGVFHLLCISGLHLTILAFFIFFCFRFALKTLPDQLFEALCSLIKPSSLAALLSIPVIIFYTVLTGGKTATVRACIMIIAYFMALLLERKKDLWQPLILAGFCILLWQPRALFRLDFQLTFLASASIIFIIEYLPGRAKSLPSSGFYLREYFLFSLYLSLAAFIVTCPLTAYAFHLISPLGILVNIVAIPLLSVILYTSLTAILMIPLGPYPAGLLLRLAALTARLLVTINATVVKIPLAFFYLPSPSKSCVIAIYACMLASALLWRYWEKRSARASKFFLFPSVAWPLLLIFLLNRSPQPDHKFMKVTFLDVGKADSCLIQTPGGKNILIDGGGTYNNTFDFGLRVVAPYLWHEKINKLDLVILSHPHPDHLNGLLFILKNFSIAQIWKTKERAASVEYQLFEKIIKRGKIPLRIMATGDQFSLDNIHLQVLYPPAALPPLPLNSSYRKVNNRSLVVKLSYRQVSFLFTGDIEFEAESQLLALGEKLRSTILKVEHHGSRYASSLAFLKKVRPQVAIFSARNYGRSLFPHPLTLARYQKLPCRIYRTDRDGAITVETDGTGFKISTENQPKIIK